MSRCLPKHHNDLVFDVQVLVVVVLVAGDTKAREYQVAADGALAAQAGDGKAFAGRVLDWLFVAACERQLLVGARLQIGFLDGTARKYEPSATADLRPAALKASAMYAAALLMPLVFRPRPSPTSSPAR